MRWFNRIIRGALASAGFQLHRFNREQVIPAGIADRELYQGPEDFSRLFRPWNSPQYDRWFTPEVLENTMLSRQKLYFLLQFLRQTIDLPGDALEAGTGSGGSAKLMLEVLRQARVTKRLWLLDTFTGYQRVDPERDGTHAQLNQCRCHSKEEVARLLADPVIEVKLIAGLIPETLEQVKTDTLSFAHIDVNLHEPTLAASDFCLQRLTKGGVILFDDYCWPATYGARQAIDEACTRHRQQVICVPESTQAFLIKK